jgi:EF-hand domain pair
VSLTLSLFRSFSSTCTKPTHILFVIVLIIFFKMHQTNSHSFCRIDSTEFLGATIEAHGHIEEIRIAEAFDRLDVDHSGNITKSDLKTMLTLSPEHIDELLADADTDKDGKISYPEFLALFRQQTHQMAKDVIREAAADTGSEGSEGDDELMGLDAHIPGGLYDSNLGPSEKKQADVIREMSVEI